MEQSCLKAQGVSTPSHVCQLLVAHYTMVREQNALFVSKCPVREKKALPMMHQAVTFC